MMSRGNFPKQVTPTMLGAKKRKPAKKPKAKRK